MTNPNDPAFKEQYVDLDGEPVCCGLTKREHFAAMTMQRLIDNTVSHFTKASDLAERSLELADALIAALNKSV